MDKMQNPPIIMVMVMVMFMITTMAMHSMTLTPPSPPPTTQTLVQTPLYPLQFYPRQRPSPTIQQTGEEGHDPGTITMPKMKMLMSMLRLHRFCHRGNNPYIRPRLQREVMVTVTVTSTSISIPTSISMIIMDGNE